MRVISSTASLLKSAAAASVLLLGASTALAQTVNLTAAPANALLPDGQQVPMWGYSCGTAVVGATAATTASCAPANPGVASGNWSPVVITVPYSATGTSLTINLTNALTFTAGTVTNTVPTSLVIVGQLGGGLGAQPTTTPSPVHPAQGATWFASAPPDTSGQVGGDPTTAGNPTFNPPAQPKRVQSFATEVAANGVTAISPQIASGSALTWSNLRPGTYLIESGTHPSIQGAMGLYGILIVTDNTTTTGTFCAYPGAVAGTCAVKYDADVPMLLSEIDPVQNRAVAAAVSTAGFLETNVWSGQPGHCGDLPPSLTAVPAVAGTCYPPAVNYSPAYYLINGVSFDRTNLAASTLKVPTPAAGTALSSTVTGQVLVRFVNAGLRMHVPSVVNAALTLYAEDGNLLPGRARVQSEVFLAAGKSYDVGIQAAPTGTYAGANLAVFDRQLSLSTNNSRDGGMQAYLAIAGGATAGVGSSAAQATLSAAAKNYYCVNATTLVVADPSHGLLGGSTSANGVALVAGSLAPITAAINLQSDGTFTYTPPAAGTCAGSFSFNVNGITATAYTATITECDAGNASTTASDPCHGGKPTANADSYTSTVGAVGALAGHLHIGSPGVLGNDTDPMGLPLAVDLTTAPTCTGTTGTCTVALLADGSFTATATAAGSYQFSYSIKNSQGTPGAASAAVSLTFPTASNLVVTLIDSISGKPLPSQDYRWIIEEDRTYYVDPACQVNSTDPSVRPATCPPLPVGSLGYSFHSANMPVIATGCVGPVACEGGQTLLGKPTACDQGNGVCTDAGVKTQRDALDPSQVALDPTKRYYLSVAPADGINPTINGQAQPVDPGTGVLRPFQTVGLPNNVFNDTVGSGDCTSFVASIDPIVVGNCGHTMGGAQISGQLVALDNAANHRSTVNIRVQRTPLPTAQITAFVFEDDSPLNGENDAGGPAGANGPAPNEPGIGNFNIELFDQAGGLGDNTGQPTYDMFNQPLTNSLAGMKDPLTGFNACPLTRKADNIIGMIPVCPKYEDGVDASGNPVPSPLVGQAIIKNLYPGLYEVQAYPAADRIAAGEEWLQTNTLDGGKPHEAFVMPNEPGYFQEFGPGGFHVSIGFANPKIINQRLANTCAAATASGIAGAPCPANLYGQVTGTHMSRTPDQRTYSSGDYSVYSFTQCYVAISLPDSDTFGLAKCAPDGTFSFKGIPEGDYMLSVFDQWNDIMLDGLVSTVCVGHHAPGTAGPGGGCKAGAGGVVLGSTATDPIVFPVTQWRTNLYTRTFIDVNGDGVSNNDSSGNPTEPGLALASTNIRYRDGSFGFYNNTDLNGFAGWNEVFPFMNWLVVETTSTRFKQTGTHTVYDAGGKVDGTAGCSFASTEPCGNSTIAASLANSAERVSLPLALRAPGSVYCADADCTGQSVRTGGYLTGTQTSSGPTSGALSTGRIDPPAPWGTTMGFQGLLGQNLFVEFGMRPMAEANAATGKPAENGGIQGHVVYSSTRPFDDPSLLLHLQWEPSVPRVRVNLYQESTAADGEQTLKLVDTTATTSWDDWAQGFRRDANGNLMTYTYTDASGAAHTGYIPNMNCPGQDPGSPFYAVLAGSTQYLDDPATHPTIPGKLPLAANAQFKCYDGWSQLNQIQPAPYDGKYTLPSVVNVNPVTGRPAGIGTAVATSGGSMAGSNCTICIANPVDGTPMLPAGKYVVEVVLPPGFEIVKEEDKNILMGDIYVAPVSVQFPGIGGSVFIMPDQAAVNATYNKNNPLNMTSDLGSKSYPRHEGDTGSIEAYWPCVGAMRIVPDYNSLFPGAGQNAPFAGAKRPLCDRKEVTVQPQATALAKFYVFTAAHIAGHFTGLMTNDFASEFDPFSPQFGEKFGPPNLPIGLRDFSGNEMSRVYADQWGVYNGLYFSSWEVNPPNPTGYAPQMSIACMNDPGPIPRRNALGQYLNAAGTVVYTLAEADSITDPAYSSAYSNFCYEQPFMPGFTTYMDTPVVATQAFADSYNLPDAEYPDQTPAIDSVIGDVAGPWVSATGNSITISCLGHNNADACSKAVPNPDFSGPNAKTAPYNQKTIIRHYGFGSATGTVTIAGATATCATWTNATITCTVPSIAASYNATTEVGSTCASSATPGPGQTPRQALATAAQNSAYRCGELVITAANGKKSIDTVTVTVGGKPPTVVQPSSVIAANTFGATVPNPVQTAINNAASGDLIILAPGTYKEKLIMWKPVRLQGAGPGSVVLNADAHPAGSLDAWRRQIDCLFGLSTNGVPISPDTKETRFDAVYTCPVSQFLRADRIPFEPIVGWDATGNGNLAQVLQEPTLMGAYEGAGVTVVGRGVKIPATSSDFWGIQASLIVGIAGAFPDGSTYLNGSSIGDCAVLPATGAPTGRDYFTSNFKCNPSRIDGMSILNSSQGGGAVFMHGWAHYLEVANTRESANHGTLSGGINLGNGETPPLNVYDNTVCGPLVPNPKPLCPPFSTSGAGAVAPGGAIPFQLNVNVRLHHNDIYSNASLGDALFSGTPSGGGGITISSGADNYRLDHNWIAGNLSTGDGGGIEHSGVSFNARIDHNAILFNQSTNPTLPTNGGGIGVIGAANPRVYVTGPLAGQECGTLTDADCPPGLSDGTGNNLAIDANLILGNSAESGSGGGLRLQQVNGTEVTAFPRNADSQWYSVSVTNNIIANNVAGWDGAGVSLEDTLRASIINNTIASNDTTASAGVLFKTLAAANASSPPPGCTPTTDPTKLQNSNCLSPNAAHIPQPAGLVTMKNTPNMVDGMNLVTPSNNGTVIRCPSGYGYLGPNGTDTLRDGNCRLLSLPNLVNNLFWQNRAFHVEISGAGTGLLSQQNLVALVPMLNQTSTGMCATGGTSADGTAQLATNYWDVGVRDDQNPNDGQGGAQLTLTNSILTPVGATLYRGTNNVYPTASPVVAQYCNGSRVPPENGGHGFQAPPGAAETTGLASVFVFNNITPAATVDEGHNWINLTYGPLTLFSDANKAMLATGTVGPVLAAYSIPGTSPAVNGGVNVSGVPTRDYFGNARGSGSGNGAPDIGAVEYQSGTAQPAIAIVSPAPLAFGQIATSTTATKTLTLANNGGAPLTGINIVIAGTSFSRPTFAAGGTCGAILAANQSCTINVQYSAPATANVVATGTATITGSVAVINSPVTLTATSATPTLSAQIGPNPLAFGNWAAGTTSSRLALNVVNTGNTTLTGLAFTFGGGSPQPFARNGGTCGTTLAVGATCTVLVQFSPATATVANTSFGRTLTVAAGGGAVITRTDGTTGAITLTGTALASTARAHVTMTPNPLTITLPPGVNALAGIVTIMNTEPVGGAQLYITNVTASAPAAAAYNWSAGAAAGPDTCIGATLAPQQTCVATGRFNVQTATRSTAHPGSLNIIDNGVAGGIDAATGLARTNGQSFPTAGVALQVAFRDGLNNTACTGANITTLTFLDVSGPHSICVVNTATAGDVTMSGLATVTNTFSNQFSRTGGTCGASTVLTPGSFCTVIVTRARPTVTPFDATGNLTLTDTGAAGSPQVLRMLGN